MSPGDANTFYVDKIIGKRIANGRLEYLIKWENAPGKTIPPGEEETWEPSVNLIGCQAKLKEFEAMVAGYEITLTGAPPTATPTSDIAPSTGDQGSDSRKRSAKRKRKDKKIRKDEKKKLRSATQITPTSSTPTLASSEGTGSGSGPLKLSSAKEGSGNFLKIDSELPKESEVNAIDQEKFASPTSNKNPSMPPLQQMCPLTPLPPRSIPSSSMPPPPPLVPRPHHTSPPPALPEASTTLPPSPLNITIKKKRMTYGRMEALSEEAPGQIDVPQLLEPIAGPSHATPGALGGCPAPVDGNKVRPAPACIVEIGKDISKSRDNKKVAQKKKAARKTPTKKAKSPIKPKVTKPLTATEKKGDEEFESDGDSSADEECTIDPSPSNGYVDTRTPAGLRAFKAKSCWNYGPLPDRPDTKFGPEGYQPRPGYYELLCFLPPQLSPVRMFQVMPPTYFGVLAYVVEFRHNSTGKPTNLIIHHEVFKKAHPQLVIECYQGKRAMYKDNRTEEELAVAAQASLDMTRRGGQSEDSDDDDNEEKKKANRVPLLESQDESSSEDESDSDVYEKVDIDALYGTGARRL